MHDLATLVSSLAQELLSGASFEQRLPSLLGHVGRAYAASHAVCHVGDDGAWREFRWHADRDQPATGGFDASAWLEQPSSSTVAARRLELPGAANEPRHAIAAGIRLAVDDALHWLVVRHDPFTDAELESLVVVLTTLALGSSRSAMQQVAIFDAGTGLYNRRYLEETLDHEVERAKRYRVALTLLILDIDHFKEINDTLGHLTGDRALSEVAGCLLASTRGCDTIVRYGGDEFVVLLPGTTLAGAKRVAERVQERMRGLSVGSGRKKTRLSLSGGAAAVHARTTAHRLLRAADETLYEAKRQGRDRVVFPTRRVPELSPQLNLLASVQSPGARRRKTRG